MLRLLTITLIAISHAHCMYLSPEILEKVAMAGGSQTYCAIRHLSHQMSRLLPIRGSNENFFSVLMDHYRDNKWNAIDTLMRRPAPASLNSTAIVLQLMGKIHRVFVPFFYIRTVQLNLNDMSTAIIRHFPPPLEKISSPYFSTKNVSVEEAIWAFVGSVPLRNDQCFLKGLRRFSFISENSSSNKVKRLLYSVFVLVTRLIMFTEDQNWINLLLQLLNRHTNPLDYRNSDRSLIDFSFSNDFNPWNPVRSMPFSHFVPILRLYAMLLALDTGNLINMMSLLLIDPFLIFEYDIYKRAILNNQAEIAKAFISICGEKANIISRAMLEGNTGPFEMLKEFRPRSEGQPKIFENVGLNDLITLDDETRSKWIQRLTFPRPKQFFSFAIDHGKFDVIKEFITKRHMVSDDLVQYAQKQNQLEIASYLENLLHSQDELAEPRSRL